MPPSATGSSSVSKLASLVSWSIPSATAEASSRTPPPAFPEAKLAASTSAGPRRSLEITVNSVANSLPVASTRRLQICPIVSAASLLSVVLSLGCADFVQAEDGGGGGGHSTSGTSGATASAAGSSTTEGATSTTTPTDPSSPGTTDGGNPTVNPGDGEGSDSSGGPVCGNGVPEDGEACDTDARTGPRPPLTVVGLAWRSANPEMAVTTTATAWKASAARATSVPYRPATTAC